MTLALLLLGGVLIALAFADTALGRLPLTPAVVVLVLGWTAGHLLDAPGPRLLLDHAAPLAVALELVLLSSLFAVGLRLTPRLAEWRVALWLAGPSMLVLIALAAAVAFWLLELPWQAALLLAAMLAPTDPVLASDVQIRSDADRDAVRVSLTAEGGLNDASALPALMLALGLLDLRELGEHGLSWLWADLLWPLAGGLLLGLLLGRGLGHAIGRLMARGDALARDELLYAGVLALGYGVARLTEVSPFMLMFALGANLLLPLRLGALTKPGAALAERLHAFGRRGERLIEALMVMALGVLLAGLEIGLRELGFALVLLLVLRPLSVYAVVWPALLPPTQRRLVAWFGIRGIGSLYYLVFAIEQGVATSLARALVDATLTCVALSIVLHGISSTPLMAAYHRRRGR